MSIRGVDSEVERVANAIMMAFIKKWFLGAYRGPVFLDCVNGEMAWLEEAKAAIAVDLTTSQILDLLLSRVDFDGMDENTFTIGELRRAI